MSQYQKIKGTSEPEFSFGLSTQKVQLIPDIDNLHVRVVCPGGDMTIGVVTDYAIWGQISGTLSDQLDLQSQLDAKAAINHNHDGVYSPVSHNHAGVYEPANANIQTHIAITDGNPHGVDHIDVGAAPAVHYHSEYLTDVFAGANVSIDKTDPQNPIISTTGISSVAWGQITGLLSDQTDLQTALDGKAPSVHTHTEAQITNLDKYTQVEVDGFLSGKSDTSHNHAGIYEPANANIQAHIGTVVGNPHNVLFAELTDAPTSLPPDPHTHVESEITNLDKYTKAEVDALVAGFSSYHQDLTGREEAGSHPIAAITGLDGALSGKSDTGHTHTEADVTNLDKYTQAQVDTLLSGKSDTTHNHDGTYEPANANIQSHIASTSNPHSVTYGQLTGVPTEFPPSAHTHTESEITNLDKYTQAEVDALVATAVPLTYRQNRKISVDDGASQQGFDAYWLDGPSPDGSASSAIMNIAYSADWVTQLCLSWYGNGVYYRNREASVWGNWTRLLTEVDDGGRFLPIAGKAADSELLDGYNSAATAVGSTIPIRNSSGDLTSRIFISTFATDNADIHRIMTKNSANDSLRPSTPAAVKTALDITEPVIFAPVNTESAPVFQALPDTPSNGDQVAFVDVKGTFATNNLTIGRNGNNIMGLAEDMTVSTNYTALVLEFYAPDSNWVVVYKT